jgi:hypothetical protein
LPLGARLALPAQRGVAGCRLAGIVAIGEPGYLATVGWQVERAQAGGRKRRRGRMSCCLHGGETRLDPFPNHQHVGKWREPHRAAPTRTEYHFLWLNRRLPV